MANKATLAAIGAAVVVVAGLAIAWLAGNGGGTDTFAQCRKGAPVAGGQIGGPFTLTDENGRQVTDADIITKPSLVYFGYTYCPDVCPIDSARNGEASEILTSRGYDVQPVFISVDTERDTPEQLRSFTDIMDPKMIGLTGTPQQIHDVAREYRVYFKVDKPGDPNTLIDHSTQTYLVFPKLGFVQYFDRDTTPQKMADTVACFIDAQKAQATPQSGQQ